MSSYSAQQQHPVLFLSPKGVAEIKASIGKYPLFDKSIDDLRQIADAALDSGIVVPIPKDAGGGYTHEKHKKNYYEMSAAGTMYQITGKTKYAQFVKDMLMRYAQMYPTLGLHPATKSDTRGRLFWQSLNDAVWLFHTANAYDCIYDFLKEPERIIIEDKLFYPMADFLTDGNKNNYATFNKMHNHGTWALAAVGLIGSAMGNQELITKAMKGSNMDGRSGFFKQLDEMFSPDGYFTEGPYYQRYSIWPFMIFAQAINNKQPELKIFEYRDGILLKAVNTTIQSAYNGEFFYLNDALLKTYKTQEMVCAVDIAYKNNPENKQLLDIARQQDAFFVSDAGLATAKAVYQDKVIPPYILRSQLLTDGSKGDQGGIAILRNGKPNEQTCLTFKATAHGLSHGHYDKLSIALFDNGNCILPDYGAVRFLNIEPKNGGNYTMENYTWGMQTIAHNTVTIDERSHFNADFKVSSANHSVINYCNLADPDEQVVSGSEQNAYKGTVMQRTTGMMKNDKFEFPFIIDIFRVKSDSARMLDLPFYYRGQLISTDFTCPKYLSEIKSLGTKNGYQHLWLEASAKSDKPTACFTFVNDNRFYSITTLTNSNSQLLMTRTGAGDPEFNLRSETGFMIRQKSAKNHSFVSIIEPHGLYDLTREVTSGYQSNISNLEIQLDDENYTVIKIETKNSGKYIFATVNKDFDAAKKRTVLFNGATITFTGNYGFIEIKK